MTGVCRGGSFRTSPLVGNDIDLGRGLDEGAEEGAGGFVVVEGALGVPLDGDDKVIGRGAFQGFDDAVVGAVSDRAKALAEGRGGLVVGGVDGDGEAADLRG